MAQVLVVKYENQADAKVFETPYESQADLAVLEVPYEQQATGDAVWHMVHYESQATFKIFKVKYEAQAASRSSTLRRRAGARRGMCWKANWGSERLRPGHAIHRPGLTAMRRAAGRSALLCGLTSQA